MELPPGVRTFMLGDLIFILGLVVANGVFSAAEMAMVTARHSRLKELAGRGHAGAARVLALRAHPENLLATIQVGLTLISSLAAAFGGARLTDTVAAWLRGALAHVPGAEAYPALPGELALGMVVGGVAYVTLVIGELVPKSVAMHHAETLALWSARPLAWLSGAARPVVWLLTQSSNLLLKPFGDRASFTESRVNAEELRVLIEEASRSGALDPRSGDIASRALDFNSLTAGEVCVPRARLKTVDMRAGREEILRVFCEEGFHRMPVVDETPDKILGYVTATDVMTTVQHGNLLVLHDLVRKAMFVPETTRAPALLRLMQEKRERVAMVVDEHGGLVGMVTVEDLFEELVGEFHESKDPSTDGLREVAPGRWMAAGMTPLRELERATGLRLPQDLAAETVAGVVLMLAGEIPQAGRSYLGHGATWRVTSRTERRVKQVEVTLDGMDGPSADDVEKAAAARD
ncbi:MAG: HlyC/CorC family transporter [Deltaproteobacteria bacterium]|nr:HlyC/CorC family transporter [Deltaproteobacteria bacterium]